LGLQYKNKGSSSCKCFAFATSDSIIYLRFSFWQNHIGKLTQWNQVVSFIGNSNFPQVNASSFVNYFSCCRNDSVAFGFQMIGCDLDPRTSLTSEFTKASMRHYPHSLPKLPWLLHAAIHGLMHCRFTGITKNLLLRQYIQYSAFALRCS
jgi:hypothetical protein